MDLSKLVFPEKNVRKHPEAQIEALGESLKMFGQTRPIVVDENNVVLVGNGLAKAMLELGWKKATVKVKKGLTDAQKKKLMIADNRLWEMGGDDHEVIYEFMQEMDDLDIPGFDKNVLEKMLSSDEEIETFIDSYGSPREDAPNKKVEAPQAPVRSSEPQEAAVPQVKCPHCGAQVWAE